MHATAQSPELEIFPRLDWTWRLQSYHPLVAFPWCTLICFLSECWTQHSCNPSDNLQYIIWKEKGCVVKCAFDFGKTKAFPEGIPWKQHFCKIEWGLMLMYFRNAYCNDRRKKLNQSSDVEPFARNTSFAQLHRLARFAEIHQGLASNSLLPYTVPFPKSKPTKCRLSW